LPEDLIETSVSLNGADIFYEVRGAGPPLLLLHGGTGCHSDWAYAGREHFIAEYRLIVPDARGHGSSRIRASAAAKGTAIPDSSKAKSGEASEGQQTLTHRQCALDTLALLDHLGVDRCKAIGISMGGNILLHMATLAPERIEAMVVVSATMYFPEQARAIMAAVPAPEKQPQSEWDRMRASTSLGMSRSLRCGNGGARSRTATTT
jgi:pimeloyl-ACP methyl ester carboxylesterase